MIGLPNTRQVARSRALRGPATGAGACVGAAHLGCDAAQVVSTALRHRTGTQRGVVRGGLAAAKPRPAAVADPKARVCMAARAAADQGRRAVENILSIGPVAARRA